MFHPLRTAAQPHCDVTPIHANDWTSTYRKRLSESHSLQCTRSAPLVICMQAQTQAIPCKTGAIDVKNKSFHVANQHLCHQKGQKSVHVFVTILKLSLIWCREEKRSEACVGQICQISISAVAAKLCTTEAGLTVRLRKEKTRTYHWLPT